jgi:hypothetical protein
MKSTRFMFPHSLLALITLVISFSSSLAAIVSLNAVAETSLFERNPDANLGGTSLVSGTGRIGDPSRGLFRFDVSSLPAGAIITHVEVQLYCTRRPDPDQLPGPAPSDFSLHRVFVGWGEGTGSIASGTNANPGEATWNSRLHGSTPWAAPGALIGTEYATNPSASISVDQLGLYTWTSSAELLQDIETWRTDPASNFGFILISSQENVEGTGRRFATKEASDGQAPPRLIITYIPEPSISGLLMLSAVGASFRRNRKITC